MQKEIRRIDLEKTLPSPNIAFFKADLWGGNVYLLVGDDEKASLRVQWRKNRPDLLPKFYLEGSTVYLEAKQIASFIGQKDPFIMEVTLPKNTNICVKMFAGVLFIDRFSGSIDVSLKAGEILGSTSSSNIKAKVFAGSLDIGIEEVQKESKIDLHCTLGDVKARFPFGFFPPLHKRKVKNGFVPNPINADIQARVTLGDIQIH